MMDCVSKVTIANKNFTWDPINIFFFVFNYELDLLY